mmetsp:Transcript_11396/g.12749  ORF Transcript_11396/g.12749 Transcript_11396/m.12749 type:complete len:311 (-) Transcript_11396:113-1045(-)
MTMESTKNPWENAVSDHDWSRSNLSEEQKVESSEEESSPDEEIACKIVRFLVNSWHFFDFLIGLVLLIYGVVLKIEGNILKIIFGALVSLGVVLIVRASVGTYSVYKDQYLRFGMKISAYLSSLLSLSFFVTSMISLGEKSSIVRYLDQQKQHLHLPDSVTLFLKNNIHFIWISLLVLCGLEAIRWISLLNYREYLLEDDALSVQLMPLTSVRNRKPWWWKRQNTIHNQVNDLNDPLLGPSWTVANSQSYQMDEGLDQANKGNSLWSKLFEKRNLRDDASVDFASVQEDWASKSEEDPLWWTREEGKTNG